MAKLTLRGGAVKTAEIARLEQQANAFAERLEVALRDLDEQRKRAQAAEQDLDDERERYALLEDSAHVLTRINTEQGREIDRLTRLLEVVEATALPRLSDQPPVSTGTMGALIGEALDMEIGGAEK